MQGQLNIGTWEYDMTWVSLPPHTYTYHVSISREIEKPLYKIQQPFILFKKCPWCTANRRNCNHNSLLEAGAGVPFLSQGRLGTDTCADDASVESAPPVKRVTAVTARSSQYPEANVPGLITVSTKYLCGLIAFPVGFGPNKDDHYYWFSSTLYANSELELYGNEKE